MTFSGYSTKMCILKQIKVIKMSVLEELYNGNINPSERYIKENSKYQKQNKQLAELIDKLIPMLNEDEKRICENIGDILSSMSFISERESFLFGFRTGAQMILEIMNYESQNFV